MFDANGLAIARESNFWTQSDLAQKVGVTTRAVQRWEGGESQPQFAAVRALAELFAIPPDHLYAPDPSGDDTPTEVAA